MKKEFGVFLILGLLVLSLSFTSAGWFSDTWNTVTGKVVSTPASWKYQETPDSVDTTNRYAIYMNYTKPVGATASSLWLVKHGAFAPYNITIPSACWNANSQKLILAFSSNTNNGAGQSVSFPSCFNGTAWTIVGSMASENFYWWNNYPCASSSIALDGNWDNFIEMNQYQNYNDSKNCWTNTTSLGNAVRIYEEAMYWSFDSIPTVPQCRSFDYSDWSTCYNGVQTRTIIASYPSGCSGGSPVLSQDCNLVNNTCTDSDGGINYYVRGHLVDEKYNAMYDDQCANNTSLKEYYCGPENYLYETYLCPDGCAAGVCLNVTAPNITCTDSDGGINYNVKGFSQGYLYWSEEDILALNNYSDFCSKDPQTGIDYASDFYCDSRSYLRQGAMGLCPNGCVDGACVNSSVLIEPKPSCAENYKLRATNFKNEEGYDKVTLQRLVNGAWEDFAFEKKVGDMVSFGNADFQILNMSVISSNRYVFLYASGATNFDYKQLATKEYQTLNSQGVVFNYTGGDRYFVASYCGNTSVQVCQAEVNMIKNPSDLMVNGMPYSLGYNNSYVDEYSGEINSYASWSGSDDNSYSYVWASVAEMKDADVVKQRLDASLENGICQISRVYMNYDSDEYQNVYICKNIWRIAQQNQQVSTGDAWNYQNDAVALWFNNNLLFSFEFSSNNYNNCYDLESCDRIEQESHRRQQNDLVAAMDDLINNKNKYTDAGYLDYRSEQFVKQFLLSCNSQVEDLGYEGSWSCRMDPAICPPHGEQKQTCTRYNQITKKDEVREATMSCNPGACSGCMVPKWFGSTWESKCIPYGFRFEHQIGFGNEITEQIDKAVLTVEEASKTSELSLRIYNDSHADLMVTGWGDTTYSFKKGDTVSIDLSALGEGYLDVSMYINDVVYNPNDYYSSYIDITFTAKRMGKTITSFDAYCDINGQVSQQKVSYNGEWAKCQNDYECFSNICSNGECVDTAALAKQLTGFKGFIVRMLCRLSNPFNEAGYAQCLADNQ